MEPHDDEVGPEDDGDDLEPVDPQFEVEMPPEGLTNLVRHDRYTTIDMKLQSIIEAAAIPPAWRDAWVQSTRGRNCLVGQAQEAEPEERLAVWQAVRDSGLLPDDAGFYLVADQIKFLTELFVGETMDQIERRIDALYTEHGFLDGRSKLYRGEEDCGDFEERCPEDWDRLYFDRLQKHGEHEMARLYRTDREHFEERMRAGGEYFYPSPQQEGPEKPAWYDDLSEAVRTSGCILLPNAAPATLVMSWKVPAHDPHEVSLGVALREIRCGPRDGEVVIRDFVLDIPSLTDVFDEVQACYWESFDGNGSSSVAVQGSFRGN